MTTFPRFLRRRTTTLSTSIMPTTTTTIPTTMKIMSITPSTLTTMTRRTTHSTTIQNLNFISKQQTRNNFKMALTKLTSTTSTSTSTLIQNSSIKRTLATIPSLTEDGDVDVATARDGIHTSISVSPMSSPNNNSNSSSRVGSNNPTKRSTTTTTVGAEVMSEHEHVVGYLSRILNARVYEACIETELQHAKNLSTHLRNTIYLKREDTQPVFSFKIRGAYNKMANINTDELQKFGVVCCSAGNHAQGVALSARMLQCRAIIVMPITTPSIKVNAVRVHGGPTVEVRLFGNTYDEAAVEAKRLQLDEQMIFVHPFDDPDVIAGQGTIGMEILKECVSKPIDAIFVCCGGGGMLAGIAAYVKRVRPTVRIIGVEASDAAGMTASLQAGHVVTLPQVGLFADGAAVKTIGTETFRICNMLVDEMITVSTDEICNAIKLSYNDARVVLEPAGALAVAGMKKYLLQNDITGKTVVAITSGANMDFDRLRFVSERADGSERTIAVTIPEQPGTFRALYNLIWPRNVTEFSYRYGGHNSSNDSSTEKKKKKVDDAHIYISFQPVLNIENDFDGVVHNLIDAGFDCLDISNNELAKVHIRHLAGGRATVPNERLFRFEFPESPGALQRFLMSLDMDWNVTLFHYRNHGDDFGRVLVGIQVTSDTTTDTTTTDLTTTTNNKIEENKKLLNFLQSLGYRYVEETDNPVYRSFLRHP